MSMYVNFSEPEHITITAYFTSIQDPDYWPNQGVVESDDPRWSVFYNQQPEFIQGFLPTPT
ncbi:hypothetical protein LOY55_10840 [Pseudomonas sp. B21-040]|uniref:hypothetical protein n=1 Tax=Pseudomonas sp. B21-040 TaxID=2895486 RepID=UPI00215F7C33|nr:hypothetical protein [Pseudomonas sp. B21-040]UVL42556.1 hypothetical protein LOY55_10840 [Pseudomonas sp. B21-040]